MQGVNVDNVKKADEYVEKIGLDFQEDCLTRKNPEACHQLAEFLCVVKKDRPRAAELFLSTCKQMGFVESCVGLGNLYLSSKGDDKDFGKALEMYDTACKGGSMGGCNNAGLVWQNGFDGNPPDHEKAADYFTRSCQGNFRNGCFNLSAMFLQGKGSAGKDMQKALDYAIKSCDLGHPWGCANASRIYQTGDGVPADEKKAHQYRSKARKLSKGAT
ncbi:hypothetical protein EMCRGX_G019623 [Ephydatia muelleri]|eukprot:Em0011g416a